MYAGWERYRLSLIPYLNKNAINWIQIHGFQNTEVIQHVCQNFNVDFLTIQDILNSDHQTKIEQHDTYNVVILKLLFSNDDGYVPQQIAIVQGGNYLLTFMEKETDFLNDINTALEKNVLKIRSRQSDFLLSVILNSCDGQLYIHHFGIGRRIRGFRRAIAFAGTG